MVSTFTGACGVTATGLPWDLSGAGGFEAFSLSSVGVALGSSGAIDVSSCMPFGSTCTLTGAAPNVGNPLLFNSTPFGWANTSFYQMSTSGLGKVKAKTCTASNLQLSASYTLTSAGANVGLR